MKIPNEIKTGAISVLPLLASIILFIVVGNFGFSQISNIRSQIDQATSDQNVLSQKVSLLTNISATSDTQSAAASVALPASNTTLAVFSQLKNLATANVVLLSNLKAGGEVKDKSGLSRVDISFDLAGTLDQITGFLNSVPSVAPIMSVSAIKLTSQGGGQIKATLTLASYWASLPTTIPATTQPETGLTPAEQTLSANVQNLIPPTAVNVAPSTSAGRANPFAQ